MKEQKKKLDRRRKIQNRREEGKKMHYTKREKKREKHRAHSELNRGPLDLQSNALPLSYTPVHRPVSLSALLV